MENVGIFYTPIIYICFLVSASTKGMKVKKFFLNIGRYLYIRPIYKLDIYIKYQLMYTDN